MELYAKIKTFHTYILYNLYSLKIYEAHTHSLLIHLAAHSTEFD